MECCICLGKITQKNCVKTLSCNHQLHYSCFLECAFNNKGTIFINCPLCRVLNVDNNRPYLTDQENILAVSLNDTKRERCCCKTKQGYRCKNPALPLNYGCCKIHNKESLPKEKYALMCDYLYHIIENSNKWNTKIYMIDIAKKILILNPKIKKIDEIHHYFVRYYHWSLDRDKNTHFNPIEMYTYYGITYPPQEWMLKCITNRIIV